MGLAEFPHPEDHETAGAYEQLLGEILAKLKPILRYVCTPVDFYNAAGISGTRCFLVGTYDRGHEWEKDTPVHVFLSETGAFFEAQKQAFLIARKSDKLCMLGAGGADGTDVAKVLTEGYNDPFCTWNQLPFLDLLTGLQATLEEAERKRRQHLEAVATRNSFLKRMLATAQNFSMVPYRRFRQWREVTLGTYRSNEAIARDLENHGIPMVDPTPEILRAIPVREYGKTEEIDLANVSPKELGFTVEPTRDEITTRAEQFGLVKIPPEAAPIALIREFVLVQRTLHVAMDPVPVGKLLLAFMLLQVGKKQLTYDDCRPEKIYGLDTRWLFALRERDQ